MAIRNQRSKKPRYDPIVGVREFSMNKGFGQHLLVNTRVLDAIIEKSQLKSTDTVLEIGPGTGNLTMRLLQKVKKVIAIELDPRMVAELQKKVTGTPFKHKLQLLVGNVLKIKLPKFDAVVANIPYNISSPLTFKLLAHRPFFRVATIMYQKEFAQRLCASPGDTIYCRLSLNTQLLSKVEHVLTVSKNSFRPPPKVDSAVVRFLPNNPAPPVNFLEWDGLLRIVFNRKNKTLSAIFKNKNVLAVLLSNYKMFLAARNQEVPATLGLVEFKANVSKMLEDAEINTRRAAKMDLDDFLKLLLLFNNKGIHFTA